MIVQFPSSFYAIVVIFILTSSSQKFSDQHLNCHSIIKTASNKVSVGIFILRTLKQTVSNVDFLSAYYGIIVPQLSYDVPIFRSETQRFKSDILLPQQKSCKAILRSYHYLTFNSICILKTYSFVRRHFSIQSHLFISQLQ